MSQLKFIIISLILTFSAEAFSQTETKISPDVWGVTLGMEKEAAINAIQSNNNLESTYVDNEDNHFYTNPVFEGLNFDLCTVKFYNNSLNRINFIAKFDTSDEEKATTLSKALFPVLIRMYGNNPVSDGNFGYTWRDNTNQREVFLKYKEDLENKKISVILIIEQKEVPDRSNLATKPKEQVYDSYGFSKKGIANYKFGMSKKELRDVLESERIPSQDILIKPNEVYVLSLVIEDILFESMTCFFSKEDELASIYLSIPAQSESKSEAAIEKILNIFTSIYGDKPSYMNRETGVVLEFWGWEGIADQSPEVHLLVGRDNDIVIILKDTSRKAVQIL